MMRQLLMIVLFILSLTSASWAQVKSDTPQKIKVNITHSNPDGKLGVLFIDVSALTYESSDVVYDQGGGQTFQPTGFGHSKFFIGVGMPIFKTLTLFGGYQRLSNTTKSDFGNWKYKVTSNAIFIKGRFYLDFN